VASTVSYETAWETFESEKKTNSLQPLAKDFYSSAIKYLSSSLASETEKSNMAKILIDLFEKRKQKILAYIAYGKQLPSDVPSEELDFYERITKIAKNEKLNITNDENKILLRVLKDIPEIVLPSGSKIGPLSKDEIIRVDSINEDVKFLLDHTICEKV